MAVKKKQKRKRPLIEVNGVAAFRDAKLEFEEAYVRAVLTECGGVMTEGARLSGKDRKDFYDLVRRTGVDYDEYRE